VCNAPTPFLNPLRNICSKLHLHNRIGFKSEGERNTTSGKVYPQRIISGILASFHFVEGIQPMHEAQWMFWRQLNECGGNARSCSGWLRTGTLLP
jgi:hypothetical protein